jgi:hypothetical protein
VNGRAHRIGAIFYILWGLLHVVGGAVLLSTWTSAGSSALMRSFGSAVASSVPETLPAVVGGVGAFHAFNLVWIGLLVIVVAAKLNWHNSRTGAWLNGTLAGMADLGLVVFLLLPGYMPWAEGAPGIVLFVPALLFTAVGRRWPAEA